MNFGLFLVLFILVSCEKEKSIKTNLYYGHSNELEDSGSIKANHIYIQKSGQKVQVEGNESNIIFNENKSFTGKEKIIHKYISEERSN